jgi:hypothetical protein
MAKDGSFFFRLQPCKHKPQFLLLLQLLKTQEDKRYYTSIYFWSCFSQVRVFLMASNYRLFVYLVLDFCISPPFLLFAFSLYTRVTHRISWFPKGTRGKGGKSKILCNRKQQLCFSHSKGVSVTVTFFLQSPEKSSTAPPICQEHLTREGPG